jgi:TolA-binding protein
MTNTGLVRSAVLLPALVLCGGCATGNKPGLGAKPSGDVVRLDMEPIEIEATHGADGVHIEAFDAPELFERAGQALSDKRFDEAVQAYQKLLSSFPDSAYVRPSYYNLGLAQIGKKNLSGAINAFKALIDRFPTHQDAKDSRFQLGACYAEQANWVASAEVFGRLLERQDLNADDRIEAMARRGFAELNLGQLDTAENTFRSLLAYQQQIDKEERLATDFYLAFAQYHLGQINHMRFRKAPLRLPESQLDKDLDEKARLLLVAQRAYIDTIKFGNPAWASAAGFQVGSLYEELYDAFTNVPVPAELDGEARQIYIEELHKKIRVLLEKSLRWQRENLLMIERLGVATEWADKSRLAYVKVMKLLDPDLADVDLGGPGGRLSPGPGPDGAHGAPPPVPRAPARGAEGGPSEGAGQSQGDETPSQPLPSGADSPQRSVL